MMIGDVPVPVTLELDILLDTVIDGSVTEPCDAGYSGSHTISAGMGFSGTWTATGGPPGMSFELPEMSVGPLSDCSIRIAVPDRARVSFYSADTALVSSRPLDRRGLRDTSVPRLEMEAHGRPFDLAEFYARDARLEDTPLRGAGAGRQRHPQIRARTRPRTISSYASGAARAADRTGSTRPRGIAIGPRGDLYVTDQNNHRVVVFDRLGEYLGEWGSYGSSAGLFIFPAGIAVASDGSVLVSDSGNHRVQRFTAGGEFLGQWGDEGTGEGQFVQLEGIAAGPDSLMAVCDSGTSSFSIFTVTGGFIGRFPSVLARGAAFDAASDIYTAGCRSGGVTRTDRSGRFLASLGPDLCMTDIALDGAGKIYVLDYDLGRLEILDPYGNVISGIGSSGDGPGEFDRPGGVAVSPEGWVYIADTANNRIQVFAPK